MVDQCSSEKAEGGHLKSRSRRKAESVGENLHQIWGGIEKLTESSEEGGTRISRRTGGTQAASSSASALQVQDELAIPIEGIVFCSSSDSSAKKSEPGPNCQPQGEQSQARKIGRLPEWSKGAMQHEAGTCKPCSWHWKDRGCINKADCKFCHMCDKGALKARRKEKMIRTRAAREEEAIAEASVSRDAPALRL